jgi:hypothetical protein
MSVTPPGAVVGSGISASTSEIQNVATQLQNQFTIAQALSDLKAEGQPIPKNLTVSQAQQIINDFPQVMAEKQMVQGAASTPVQGATSTPAPTPQSNENHGVLFRYDPTT